MPKRVDGCGEFRKGSSGPSPPVTGRAKAHSEPLADRHLPSGKVARVYGVSARRGRGPARSVSIGFAITLQYQWQKRRGLRSVAPLAETAARRCFPAAHRSRWENRAVRELHGVPTSWISFVEGEGSFPEVDRIGLRQGKLLWWETRARGSVRRPIRSYSLLTARSRVRASPSAHSGQQAYERARRAWRIRRRVQPGRTGRIGCFRENTSVSSIADFASRCRAPSERSGEARLQCRVEEHATRVSV